MQRNPEGRREGENSDETGHVQDTVQTEAEKAKLDRRLRGPDLRLSPPN